MQRVQRRTVRGTVLRVVSVAVALVAIFGAAGTASAAVVLPWGFQESTVFSGLTQPTTFRFASDGRVFVAEKSGLIKVFDNLSDTTPSTFADLRTEVHNYWDRGLLGLALDPDFPATPYVYVLYTYDAGPGQTAPIWNDACPTPPGPTTDGCVVTGRLSRLTASSSGSMTPGSEQVLLSGWCQQFPSHSIGDLEFGPDGALYVSGGEGASFGNVDYGQYGGTTGGPTQKNACGDPPSVVGGTMSPPTAEGGALRSLSLHRSAGPAVLSGTVIRISPATGLALPDNPLASSSDPVARRIVAEGLRNPFRFAFRPGTSDLWVGDVGWSTWEEIDRHPTPATSVANFGWPCYEGGAAQPTYVAAGLDICTGLFGEGSASSPYYTYNHLASVVSGDGCTTGSSSITGLAFYTGGPYPSAYDGALFFADHSRNCIWSMATGSNGLPDPAKRAALVTHAAGPVDLQTGPGGDLFYAGFDDGTIRRIQYFAVNRPPIAVAAATPTSGDAPLTVSFDGSGSSDPDPVDTITYAWDLDGDGAFDDSTAVKPSYTYANVGTHTAFLRVTDSEGLSTTSAPVVISAGNTPPTPVIDAPASSLLWKVGDTIPFSGHATDRQDGAEPASRLVWTLKVHHCPSDCHVHAVQTFDGLAAGSFSTPDHEYPSHLELQLTVTDSDGLSASTSVSLDPQTVDLTFESNPSSMQLSGATVSATTPFTSTSIVGSAISISAPDQPSDGVDYVFDSWSDGGAQTHTITAPAADTTYAATFVKKNHPPVAMIAAQPTSGEVPLVVRFDGSGSNDPDGDTLAYSWDLNGDGVFGDSTAARPVHTYTEVGQVPVQLQVTDGRGGSATTPATIQPRAATFHSRVTRIPRAVRNRMVGSSWQRGCPVPLGRLRLVTVSFHRFDGRTSQGQLIIHRREARKIVRVMRKLYRADYPIRRMRLVDDYGARDRRSKAADNTSAFNCRVVEGTSRWSVHAYGLAIDINPVENPFVTGRHVSPAKGKPYADRRKRWRGMIHAGDAVVRAFRSVGWSWGGSWRGGTKGYQHFSANGR